MPIVVYKVLHYVGIAMLLAALGGVASNTINGDAKDAKSKKVLAAAHGVSLLLILVAGGGMMAKLGASWSGGWVIGKLALWLVLGAALSFVPRLGKDGAKVLLFVLPVLVGVAAWLALAKPGV